MYTCVRGIYCFSCIHDRSLYWSGTCSLIIIIIKDIIETEKQSLPLTHVYMTVAIVSLVWYMYINNNNNNERYHRNRETIATSDTCIHDRSLYWSGTCTLLIIIIKELLMYMYQTSTVNGHVYMCQRYRLFFGFYDIFYFYYY
jgi:hypothetical protein